MSPSFLVGSGCLQMNKWFGLFAPPAKIDSAGGAKTGDVLTTTGETADQGSGVEVGEEQLDRVLFADLIEFLLRRLGLLLFAVHGLPPLWLRDREHPKVG
jgi:hypothetical protein